MADQRLPIPPQVLPDAEYCREGATGRLWLWSGRLYAETLDGVVRRADQKDLGNPPANNTNPKEGKMPAATKPRPKKAASKKSPDWKSLPDAEKGAYLLAHVTVPDAAHTNKKRRQGESRRDFLRRIYGVPA